MNKHTKQQGFSLVELMIGLLIGLIASFVIMNVFSKFEQQKRSTVGTANAQTNGAIALYQIKRYIESSGYGLPMFLQSTTPLRCYASNADITNPQGSAESVIVNHDGQAATPEIGMSPVIIVDGAGGASDEIAVRSGNSEVAGAASAVINATNSAQPILTTAIGCKNRSATNPNTSNYALIMSPSGVSETAKVCEFVDVDQRVGNAIHFVAAPTIPISEESFVGCVGEWNEHRFAIANNQLTVTGARTLAGGAIDAAAVEMVPEIVSIQAQYGISDNDYQNNVTDWVDASGGVWGPNMTVDNRNRIKAVRVAVIARNGQRNNAVVSQSCDGAVAGVSNVCIWKQDATPANVNLANLPNWQNYRYKVYETIIPLRNTINNLPSLCEGKPC